jgi:hypothetical protein
VTDEDDLLYVVLLHEFAYQPDVIGKAAAVLIQQGGCTRTVMVYPESSDGPVPASPAHHTVLYGFRLRR